MKEDLYFVDKLYNEILEIAELYRTKLYGIKADNLTDVALKLELTSALIYSIAWILSVKAIKNNEELKEAPTLPELKFTIQDENNRILLAAKIVIENLYTRVQRLNKDLEKVLI